jgi:membrane-associated phospholipid phosphatase
MSGAIEPTSEVALSRLRPGTERLLLFAVGLAAFGVYIITGRLNYGRVAKTLATPLDDAIPFAPSWEWFYFLIYFMVAVPLFQIRDLRLLRRVIAGFVVAQIAANVVFGVLPVRMIRPEHAIEPARSFVEWGLGLNYLVDPPTNCFPSLHVGNAFYAALVAIAVDPPVGVVMTLLAALIAASTLFTKQHYAADVIGGLVLAWASFRAFVAGQIPEGVPREQLVYPRKLLLVLPAVFLAAIACLLYAYASGWTYPWPTPYAG